LFQITTFFSRLLALKYNIGFLVCVFSNKKKKWKKKKKKGAAQYHGTIALFVVVEHGMATNSLWIFVFEVPLSFVHQTSNSNMFLTLALTITSLYVIRWLLSANNRKSSTAKHLLSADARRRVSTSICFFFLLFFVVVDVY
jgi:hypothetical protein